MKKGLLTIALGLGLMSGAATAVPWCHKGTIVQIADVSWSQAQILANFSGSIPPSVYDPEYYVTYTATHAYASTFAGGGGGFGGYSVPGSGQVRVKPYAPYTYTNMVGPGHYFTSQGVQFKLEKCYTIPPLTQHLEVEKFDLDDGAGGIIFRPYKRLRAMEQFWLSPREDAQDNSDEIEK